MTSAAARKDTPIKQAWKNSLYSIPKNCDKSKQKQKKREQSAGKLLFDKTDKLFSWKIGQSAV
jgi:hypothetical protein